MENEPKTPEEIAAAIAAAGEQPPQPQDTGLPPQPPVLSVPPDFLATEPAPVVTPEVVPAPPAPVSQPPASVPAVPQPTAPAPAPAVTPVGTITVDAAKLKALMDRLDEQAGQLARLEAAASKAGLSNYDNKNRAKPGKAVKVRMYDGKITYGWRTVVNIVEKHPDTKAWTERQIVELILENDEKIELAYSLWVNHYTLMPAVVKATTVLDDDSVVYTLTLEDGREIKLGQTFVN